MEKATSGRLILVLPEARRGGSSGKKPPIRGDGNFGAGLPSVWLVCLAPSGIFGTFSITKFGIRRPFYCFGFVNRAYECIRFGNRSDAKVTYVQQQSN